MMSTRYGLLRIVRFTIIRIPLIRQVEAEFIVDPNFLFKFLLFERNEGIVLFNGDPRHPVIVIFYKPKSE